MVLTRNNLGEFPAKADLIGQKDPLQFWLYLHRTDVLLRAIRSPLGTAEMRALGARGLCSPAPAPPKLKACVSRPHEGFDAGRPGFDPGFSTTPSATA